MLKIQSLPYENLRWEKTKTINLGTDFGLFQNKVTFTLEYHSGAKKTYSDEFTIDLKAGVSMPYGKVATEGKELRTISYALQEMLQKNL